MVNPYRCECAWCGGLIRDGEMPTTHGVCNACYDQMLKEIADVAEKKIANNSLAQPNQDQ